MNTVFWISLLPVSGHLWTPILTFRLHISWHSGFHVALEQHLPSPPQSMTGSVSCYCNKSLKSTYLNKCIHKHIISRARNISSIMFWTWMIKRWGEQSKEYRSCAVCAKTTHSLSTHSFSGWEQQSFSTKSALHPQKMSCFFWALCTRLAWSRRKVKSREESPLGCGVFLIYFFPENTGEFQVDSTDVYYLPDLCFYLSHLF